MSQENVELVLRLQPGPQVDLARLFRDEHRWARFRQTAAPFYHSDFETAAAMVGVETWGRGMDGLRALWLDWLAPWATYRTELEEAIDRGEQVLVLNRSFGRLDGSTQEIREAPAAVWSVRDGRIARVEFYTNRADALAAAGASPAGSDPTIPQ